LLVWLSEALSSSLSGGRCAGESIHDCRLTTMVLITVSRIEDGLQLANPFAKFLDVPEFGKKIKKK
jgi:hypothetical protein